MIPKNSNEHAYTVGQGARTGYIVPAPQEPGQAAIVTIIRNKSFYAGGLVAKVSIDGWVVAILGTGRYVTVPVEPGQHSVGLTTTSLTLTCAKGTTYFLLVSVAPGGHGFEIERIDAGTARGYLAASREVR